jgi:hypothetical protein
MNRTTAEHDDVSVSTMFCSEYETLLDQCQFALAAWSDRSESARDAHLTGEVVGRELLRLQARFAKCYTVLQKHTQNCERCVAASALNQLHAQCTSLSPLLVC